MNKGRRNELTLLKYKKRLRRFVQNTNLYIGQSGEYNHPKTCQLFEDREQLIYKTTSTPCSCYMCSGYYKYKRHEKKREDRRLIQEALS